MPPSYLTRRNAAREFSLSVSSIDRGIASGTIRAVRVGRRVLVDARRLREWLDGLPAAVLKPDRPGKPAA